MPFFFLSYPTRTAVRASALNVSRIMKAVSEASPSIAPATTTKVLSSDLDMRFLGAGKRPERTEKTESPDSFPLSGRTRKTEKYVSSPETDLKNLGNARENSSFPAEPVRKRISTASRSDALFRFSRSAQRRFFPSSSREAPSSIESGSPLSFRSSSRSSSSVFFE